MHRKNTVINDQEEFDNFMGTFELLKDMPETLQQHIVDNINLVSSHARLKAVVAQIPATMRPEIIKQFNQAQKHPAHPSPANGANGDEGFFGRRAPRQSDYDDDGYRNEPAGMM